MPWSITQYNYRTVPVSFQFRPTQYPRRGISAKQWSHFDGLHGDPLRFEEGAVVQRVYIVQSEGHSLFVHGEEYSIRIPAPLALQTCKEERLPSLGISSFLRSRTLTKKCTDS
jgi:hypothetical protein